MGGLGSSGKSREERAEINPLSINFLICRGGILTGLVIVIVWGSLQHNTDKQWQRLKKYMTNYGPDSWGGYWNFLYLILLSLFFYCLPISLRSMDYFYIETHILIFGKLTTALALYPQAKLLCDLASATFLPHLLLCPLL